MQVNTFRQYGELVMVLVGVLSSIVGVLSDSGSIKKGTWQENRGSVFWPLTHSKPEVTEDTVMCVYL